MGIHTAWQYPGQQIAYKPSYVRVLSLVARMTLMH